MNTIILLTFATVLWKKKKGWSEQSVLYTLGILTVTKIKSAFPHWYPVYSGMVFITSQQVFRLYAWTHLDHHIVISEKWHVKSEIFWILVLERKKLMLFYSHINSMNIHVSLIHVALLNRNIYIRFHHPYETVWWLISS